MTPLLHQQWKDLYNQGVELEFRNTAHNTISEWHELTFADKLACEFIHKHLEYRIKQQPKYELAMAKQSDSNEWYVRSLIDKHYFLRPDLTVQDGTGYHSKTNVGYWLTEAEANLARAQYLDLGEQIKPEIKIGSHWERIISTPNTKEIGEIVVVNSVNKYRVAYTDFNWCDTSTFLKRFKPRPDLDQPTVCNAQPQSTTKEQPMNKLDLRLLTAENEQLDATNSEFICVLTKDNNYEVYFYSNSEDDYNKVMQKIENDEKKLHVFKYQSTVAQKPRKIIKVERS